jgi:copper oxidase (laccase) domain-containing protein
VTAVGGCTLEQPERFFSYRRHRVTGRHAGVVVLA